MDGFEKRVNSIKNRNTRIVRVQKSRECATCEKCELSAIVVR